MLDGASGAQRKHAGHWISERLSLPAARQGQEVLPRVPGSPCGEWCAVHTDTREKSEPERPRGALGPFDQRGMPDEADPVRGTLIATRRVKFPGTLSPGKKPPRQRQSVALPRPRNKFARCNPLPRAPRRLTEILQAGRMNFFSIREWAKTASQVRAARSRVAGA